MNIQLSNKTYIGKVEALEIANERGMDNLPRKGQEILHVPANYLEFNIEILGKDEQGFYIATML
jgi:hypothetical protein